jgi:hydrogenase maturation protease
MDPPGSGSERSSTREQASGGDRPADGLGPGSGTPRSSGETPGASSVAAPARRRFPLIHGCPDRPDRVVVGLGNEVARDDGIGIYVAQELRHTLADRTDVEVVGLPWAGLSLLDALARRRQAAIIDCLVTGEYEPGTVVRLDETDLRGTVRLDSSHDIDFATVIALGIRLGWAMPERVGIWGVEAKVVDEVGQGLTPPVAEALETVVSEVLQFLDTGDA